MKKMSFEVWKKKVDEAIRERTGGWLTSEAIPDWDYYTAWQEHMTPVQAAKEAIANARNF